jgi:hypothetical protein
MSAPFRDIPSDSNGAAAWHPGKLWNLWDMAELYAYSLVAAMRMLREGAEQLERAGKSHMVGVGIQTALNLSNELGMFSTQQQVITATTSLSAGRPLPEVLADVRQLIVRIEEDLRRVHFLYVPIDLVAYWKGQNLFGDVVTTKFKAAAADIDSAGKCLSVGQGTACVFHLMRAMEVVVRKLGKRMKVTITPSTTWRRITGNMDAKIKPMPVDTDAQKRKKNAWEEARANLHHVGSVWRNNTMHPAKSYTPSQARDVFNAVRVFMNGLCEL